MPNKTKSKRRQQSGSPEEPCMCPDCQRERSMLFDNPADFAVEGELKIVRTHGGAPVFVIDDVMLSELVKFHYKPIETCEGYRLGRVQLLIVPVNE